MVIEKGGLVKAGTRPPKKRRHKVEIIGVDAHLLELVRSTDLTYSQMAKRLNERYNLEDKKKLTKANIVNFFRFNVKGLEEMNQANKLLNKARADLYLEHHGVLVSDIKVLDEQIKLLIADELLETDKKAKAVADLLDKKGRLLLRHARLSGTLKEDRKVVPTVEKMQVNIFQEINDEKSELIKRLKKAEFNQGEEVIDVESKKRDS